MIYTYRCLICDHVQDAARSMADRNDCPHCEECAAETKRIITPVEFHGAFLGSVNNPGYMCPVTDTWVDSKRKRERIMREHDLLEKG